MIYILIGLIFFIIILLLKPKKKKIDPNKKINDAFDYTVDEKEEDKESILTRKDLKNQKIEIMLVKASIPLKAREYKIFKYGSIALIIFTIFILTKNIVLGAILGFAWSFVPNIILKIAAEKKKLALELQIPAALSLIRNSLEAGMSFLQSLEIVAEEVDPPIGEEFGRVLHETNLGKDLDVALNNMIARVDSQELKLVVVAVLIQRQVGGNLGDIIDIILETIKDRIQIKGELRILTSQGRLSAIVITSLPIALGIIMYLINPDYMAPLVTTTIGQILLGIVASMMGLGIFIISKIIKIDF